MIYEYQWTEDGEVEYGNIKKQKAVTDLLCYHCGCRIKKGENITLFICDDTYTICEKCASKLFNDVQN